jgi:hypothetical protein
VQSLSMSPALSLLAHAVRNRCCHPAPWLLSLTQVWTECTGHWLDGCRQAHASLAGPTPGKQQREEGILTVRPHQALDAWPGAHPWLLSL